MSYFCYRDSVVISLYIFKKYNSCHKCKPYKRKLTSLNDKSWKALCKFKHDYYQFIFFSFTIFLQGTELNRVKVHFRPSSFELVYGAVKTSDAQSQAWVCKRIFANGILRQPYCCRDASQFQVFYCKAQDKPLLE